MAIELHHLNTHGMMEQAGKVLDGVVRLKERIAELEKENAELRSKNEGMLYALADAETDLAMLQRWHKCSEELPAVGVRVLISNGFVTKVGTLMYDYTWSADLAIYNVDCYKFWMPLPKAPEEGE